MAMEKLPGLFRSFCTMELSDMIHALAGFAAKRMVFPFILRDLDIGKEHQQGIQRPDRVLRWEKSCEASEDLRLAPELGAQRKGEKRKTREKNNRTDQK